MSGNVYKPFYKKWRHLQRPIFGERVKKLEKFNKQKWNMLQRHDLKPSILKRKQILTSTRFIFGNGLKQKKAIKLFYGLKERQIKKIVRNTNPYKGSSNKPLGGLLERQLGTVLYRLNFVKSMQQGRQLIAHKKIKVNGKTVYAKNYAMKYLDLLELELGPTRKLVNRVKQSKSIYRLRNSKLTAVGIDAEYTLNTYKDKLNSSFKGLDLEVSEDGESLIPAKVYKTTNIAPVENATTLKSLRREEEEEEEGETEEIAKEKNDSSSNSNIPNEELFNELIESTNNLDNHTFLNVKHHPGLSAISRRPKEGDSLYPKHTIHRWDKHLNEQILINVGNEKFSSEKDEMVDFLTRNTVINAVNEAKEYEKLLMQAFVARTRENNFKDLALREGMSNKNTYKPLRTWRKLASKMDKPAMKDVLQSDFLTSHEGLKRMKYKPFLSLRKPSLERNKKMKLLKMMLKNKKHPNMQIDYKNLIAVYVKELETDEVKYPFRFSYKEFLEFYNI